MGSFVKQVEAEHNRRKLQVIDAFDSFMHYALSMPPRSLAMWFSRYENQRDVPHEEVLRFHDSVRQFLGFLRQMYGIPNLPYREPEHVHRDAGDAKHQAR